MSPSAPDAVDAAEQRRLRAVLGLALLGMTGTLVLALVVTMLVAAPAVLPLTAATAAAWSVVVATAWAVRRRRRRPGDPGPREHGVDDLQELLTAGRPG